MPALPSDDVVTFVEINALMGKGLGWIDVHLLASTYASGNQLWTRDRRLAEAARRLRVTI